MLMDKKMTLINKFCLSRNSVNELYILPVWKPSFWTFLSVLTLITKCVCFETPGSFAYKVVSRDTDSCGTNDRLLSEGGPHPHLGSHCLCARLVT